MNNVTSHTNNKIIEKEGALVGYLLSGYPSKEEFLRLIKELENTKLDIIEIGFPSDNPYADGDVISSAHSTVDLDICKDIEYWKAIRESTSKPIWLMAYKKDFIDSGIYKEFASAGIMDAIVIPDCSYEEHESLEDELKDLNVDVLRFIKPTLSVDEIRKISSTSSLLYGQLYDGPTGVINDEETYHLMLDTVLENTNAKVYAGFGVNDKEKVKYLLEQGFHGVIVGTAMMKKLNISIEELILFINEIKENTIN